MVQYRSAMQVLQYIAPHVPQAVFVSKTRTALSVSKGSVVNVSSLTEYVAQLEEH